MEDQKSNYFTSATNKQYFLILPIFLNVSLGNVGVFLRLLCFLKSLRLLEVQYLVQVGSWNATVMQQSELKRCRIKPNQ
jgi:hypothetical protein